MFTGVLSLSPPPRPVFPVYKLTNSLPTYRRALLSERLEQATQCIVKLTKKQCILKCLFTEVIIEWFMMGRPSAKTKYCTDLNKLTR